MQFDPARELAAQKAGGLLQTCVGVRALLGIAEQRVIHLGVRVVDRNLDAGQRDHRDARIFELGAYDFRQFALHLIGNAQTAGGTFGTHGNVRGRFIGYSPGLIRRGNFPRRLVRRSAVS